MVKLIGGRAASAIMGIFMLALGSSAGAQDLPAPTLSSLNVPAVVRSLDTSVAAASPLARSAVAATSAVANLTSAVLQQPAQSVTVQLPSMATEAAWLYRNGWPLYALVDRYSAGTPLDEQSNCLATAVYFEARGESLEGQMAVARVVMNRAASGKYPPSWCATVKQPWQFSFVHNGQFPAIDVASDAWRKAQGIARLAAANVVPSLDSNVLWYHATYVAPSWGRRLTRADKIGAHIFYRA